VEGSEALRKWSCFGARLKYLLFVGWMLKHRLRPRSLVTHHGGFHTEVVAVYVFFFKWTPFQSMISVHPLTVLQTEILAPVIVFVKLLHKHLYGHMQVSKWKGLSPNGFAA